MIRILPTINGKSFLECPAEDLTELLDNPDFRENEYIDYKSTFSFLDKPRGNPEREKGISESRSDVCSFANAGGGYLIYGISDVKGMAKEIVGVDIPNGNTDRFELDRKNNLSPIQPKLPSLQFRFIPLFEFMHIDERYPHGRFPSIAIWERFEPVVGQYINVMKSLLDTKRIFLCVSILGCKHAVTENPADTWYPGRVDRNTIICNPVTIERIDSEEDIDNAMKWLQFEYLLSLGIKSSKTMTSLINELSDHNC